MSPPAAIYRLLLIAYPRGVRRRYGAMAITDFDRLHRDTLARDGRWAALLLWLRTIPGVLIYFGVPAILLAVTLLASFVPARRALAVDPVVSLRSD